MVSPDRLSYRIVSRRMRRHDAAEAALLFHRCVHETNAADYTPCQLDAWSPGDEKSLAELADRLCGSCAVIAEHASGMAGFGTVLFDEGCVAELDMLFVAPDMQHLGIGRKIVAELEREAVREGRRCMRAYVSLTARPFFERCGYEAMRNNEVIRRGVTLSNVVMEKPLFR